MGGRALKKTFTRRYSRVEFDKVSKELINILEKTFVKAETPLFFRNKETFGDIDIIVNKEISEHSRYHEINVREYIQETFKPNEIFHNGNAYSFDYKEVQVDMIMVESEDFDSNYHYLGYNMYNGFRIINTNKKSLRFSERIKKTKTTQIFNYNFKRILNYKKL